VLDRNDDAVLTSMLEQVVQHGTGVNAQLPDRAAAGKTGTTENYGDAWFVGYTPQLAAAVWVGYPNKLVPMTNQYQGGPVAGGTFPALIWKSFMEGALRRLHDVPESFPAPVSQYAVPHLVVFRDNRWELDNGNCRDSREIVYVQGFEPKQTADCKPNEVDVPHVVGLQLAAAESRLASMPLTAQVITRPAKPGERVGIVVSQYPSGGTLSSWDTVRIVLPKPLGGVVPKLVGLRLADARRRLVSRRLLPFVEAFASGKAGVVLAQTPTGGRAAAPGMTIRLVVGRG
jgi:hypothetical protein